MQLKISYVRIATIIQITELQESEEQQLKALMDSFGYKQSWLIYENTLWNFKTKSQKNEDEIYEKDKYSFDKLIENVKKFNKNFLSGLMKTLANSSQKELNKMLKK